MGTPLKLFICDYDNTIFPTVVYNGLGTAMDKRDAFVKATGELDELISHLFVAVHAAGYLPVIVTNAEYGWVDMTLAIYYPKLIQTIISYHIQVLSAQSLHSARFPDDVVQWKSLAFRDVINKEIFRTDGVTSVSVIVLGDSEVEIDAVKSLRIPQALCLPISVCMVKFIERPSCELLKRELEYFLANFGSLSQLGGLIDITLSPTRLGV